MMEYISVAPTLTLLIAIFWIIFAPIFFYKIFQPCWECHGFESTMAHEVGHVLGFHHPDAEWRHNLRAGQQCQAALSSLSSSHSQAALTPSPPLLQTRRCRAQPARTLSITSL